MVSLSTLSKEIGVNSQLILGVIIGLKVPYDGVGSGYVFSEDVAKQVKVRMKNFKPLRPKKSRKTALAALASTR